jgi:signal recognition particle subunit SRP54
MLERLGQVLKKATDKVANAIFLDKNLVDQIVRDLQRALIEADVNVILVKQLSDKIKKSALDERIKNIEKKEHIIKLLHEELLNILGREKKELKLKSEQNKIMLLGLYGAGKTTTIAKLGNYYAKRGKKVALIGLDVHRPAAKEQLQQLGKKNNLNVFVDMQESDAIKTWKNFKPKLKDYDLILIDTAGRHNLDEELISEIKNLGKEISPTETILVMPADIGQAAKQQAQDFKKALNITGVIITRMDSTAKAGGALTACSEVKAGVYFLTMGDRQSLIEKVRSVTNEDQQKAMQARLEEGKLSLEDVIEQVKSMNQLGGFDKIKSMIPGMSSAKIPDEALEQQQGKIAKWEHILKSMTKSERENPEIFEDKKTATSRINRIAKGAGVNNSDIRSLLKQYNMLQDMVKMGSSMDMSQGMSQKQMQKLMKKFGKKKMMKFK